MKAYDAYRNSVFLDVAVTAWNFVRPYAITAEQASDGHTPVRNGSFGTNCSRTCLESGLANGAE